MSDPTRLPEEEQAKTLHAETEEINRLEMLLAQHGQQQPIAEIEQEAKPERLFSRATLFGWAFATLLVVFIIRMVLPEVFATVKEEMVGRMREPSVNTSAPVVAPTPPTTVIAVPAEPGEPTVIAAPAPNAGTTVIKVEVKKR